MFRINLILFLQLFISFAVKSQCPTVNFTVSDTICPLKDITVVNSADTSSTYEWDFCPGDLYQTPVLSQRLITSGFGSSPEQIRIVKDQGNYYGFIANNGFSYLVRADFGNSLNNQPTYDTLVHSSLIAGLTGIDLAKENGKWVGVIVVNSPARLVRAEFDSITDQFPVLTDLNVTGLGSPLEVRLINHFAVVANLGGTLGRYNFNGSYLNIPTEVTPAISLFTLFGVDVVYDCVSSSYYAVTGAQGNSAVGIFSFGNDLSSNPTALPLINYPAAPRGVSLFNENGEWFLATTHNNDRFTLKSFGSDLTSTPTTILDTDFGGVGFSASFSCQMIKDSSTWHCFALNVNNSGLLTHFTFPSPACPVSNPWSALPEPTGINYDQTASGYYTYQVTVTDSLNDQRNYIDSVLVTILPPEAEFSAGNTCENSPVSFTDESTICFGAINGWHWDFGDSNTSSLQNPQHQFASPGDYTVTLTVYSANNDSATISQTISIVPFPSAAFGLTNNVCAAAPALFTDSSVAVNDIISSWIWSFGDGDSSFVQSPSHIYSSGGNYTVTLIATNSNGCSDTISHGIQILNSAIPAFSSTHTCSNENTQFINLTDSAGVTAVTYFWDFGDSQSATSVQPQHIYSSAGTYTVMLAAIGNNGCNDTLYKQVIVTQKPSPDFTISSNLTCTGTSIDFTDATSTGGDSVIYYHWNFGDTTSVDSLSVVSHIYNNPGTYTVTLTVATPEFCDTTIQKNITVLQSPLAGFNVTSQCFGIPLSFTNTTAPAPGDPVNSYQWLFGDSTSASATDTTHFYIASGNYFVTLIATSQAGCIDSTTLIASSFPIPTSAFTNYPMLCTDTAATFIDLSVISNDTINQWDWDFGDGQTSVLQNPQNVYSTPGIKLVTLTVTSQHGCSHTHSEIISINKSPSPMFTSNTTCLGETTCFTASDSNNPPNSIVSWQWSFGDSTLSVLQNPCHEYANYGPKNIILQATDSNNCRTTLYSSITINPLPVATFTNSQACTGTDVTFTDASTVALGSIVTHNWTINNNSLGNASQVIYNPSVAGLMPVLIAVTSDMGCSDSLLHYVQVNISPVSAFTFSPIFSAPGENVVFHNASSNANSYYWNFGDGSSDNDSAVTHIYQDTGVYNVQLITYNNNGCSDTLNKNHTVLSPDVDLAVMDVNAVNTNNLLTITASLLNLSNVDVTDFEIIAEIDGMNAVHEFPLFNIPVTSSPKLYTFQSSIQLGTEVPGFVCVRTKNPNGLTDAFPANDRRCESLGDGFDILSAQPNPANDFVIVNFNMPSKGSAIITLTSDNGSIVLEQELTGLAKGFNSVTLGITGLSDGVYSLSVLNNDIAKVVKIVKM